MTESRDPAVELIIPHMSRWDLLARLLDSVDVQTRVPTVCVVDNASSDDTLAQLERRGGVRVCAMNENAGFGRAVNTGVRTSQAELVIVVNNDMVLEPAFVAEVCRALEAEDCSVAALQLAPDGSIDTIGVGCDQSLDGFDVGHGEPVSVAVARFGHALGPSGGAAGFRRETFLETGGYDEAIFAYLEDLDLAIRLHTAGVPTRFAAGAVAHHRHSATLGSGSARKNELLGWSRGYIVWKYRNSVRRGDRLRGLLIDAIVYAGKAVIDRNLGAVRGRQKLRGERAELEQASRTTIPVTRESFPGTLRRRLGRRR